MRKLRIFEHSSLDGVTQRSADFDGFLLGVGKRLFSEGTPPRSFDFASTSTLPSGIFINVLESAGPLKSQP